MSYFKDIVANSIVLVDDRDNPVTVLYNRPILGVEDITESVCVLLSEPDGEYVDRVIDNSTGQELMDAEFIEALKIALEDQENDELP